MKSLIGSFTRSYCEKDREGYELRPVLGDVAKKLPSEIEQISNEDFERWEKVFRKSGTMEKIRGMRRKSEKV